MKKIKKKTLLLSLCAAVAAGITGIAFWLFGTNVPQSPTISAGLQQLADDSYLAACAPVGQSISFTPEWFDQGMQGAKVTGITVTALPDVTNGELKLGYGEVCVGQRITRENLSYLCYAPCEGSTQSSFSFVPETAQGAVGYALTCRLLSTQGANCCPATTGSVTAVATYSTLALDGTLTAEDTDGDALYFEVVSYPENGTLTLNRETGHFSYLPTGDFAGSDSFVWRVMDENGAISENATVEVTVRTLSTGYLFSDIADNGVHAAALLIAEKGIMGGEMMGGKHYFRPEHTLSRAAFVAILLDAAQIQYPDAEDTGFTDDADIPRGMKGAIKHAREQGWLGEDTVFRPKDAITRAEAAAIASKVLGLSTPGYSNAVEDHESIPVSVVDALYSAYEGGYIETMADGTLSPTSALTRADAARFFSCVLEKGKAS